MEKNKCYYCGEDADTRDHIIPLSFYYDKKRRKNSLHLTNCFTKDNIVDCCKECNVLSGNNVFDSVEKKKEYIQDKLRKKYKKIIKMPEWNEEEISELGNILSKEIRINQLAKKWILNRVNYPIEIYPIINFNKDLKVFLNKYF